MPKPMDELFVCSFQIALDSSSCLLRNREGLTVVTAREVGNQGPCLAARHLLWTEDALESRAGELPGDHLPAPP